MRNRRGSKPTWVKDTASEIIGRLLTLAEKGGKRSKRYVELAQSISQKYNTPLPAEWRGRVCRKCGVILKPGKNAMIRISRGFILCKCAECGAVRRKGFAKRVRA
jgi:RNase P subunit RPR2